MKLKFDLHIHTTWSRDAFTRPEILPDLARNSGLDGLAVTDHDCTLQSKVSGTVAIPGIEVSSRDGHVIGLGINSPVPKGVAADQTIDAIHAQEGVAIIPHPYDLFRKSVRPEGLHSHPDAIEVVNSSSMLHSFTWKKAMNYATEEGIPMVAGSDSHIPQTLGRAYTLIDANSDSVQAILDAIRTGSVKPAGRPITIWERLRKMALSGRRD